MKRGFLKFLLPVTICGFPASYATAAVSLFSEYGQIQNVQNYSSNPFWSPDSPYNQRLPQPVYAQGPDLKSGDCLSVVQSLVAAQCMTRNNCKNTQLSDIRPAIMVQLSNLPGKNYVSSCSGYIDDAFNNYKKQITPNFSNGVSAFPEATASNPNFQKTVSSKQSSVQTRSTTKPKWQDEVKERTEELLALQAQTAERQPGLESTDFPLTYADRSFTDQHNDMIKSYTPYKDLDAYKLPKFHTDDEWCPDHPDEPGCAEWNEAHNKNTNNPNQVPKTPSQFKEKHTDSRNAMCQIGGASIKCCCKNDNTYTCQEDDITTDLETQNILKGKTLDRKKCDDYCNTKCSAASTEAAATSSTSAEAATTSSTSDEASQQAS